MKRILVLAVLAALAALALVSLGYPPGRPQSIRAAGQIFDVNSNGDADDVSKGDGHCDVDNITPGDQCTLRAAISEANATPDLDTITFHIPDGPNPGCTFPPGTVPATPPPTTICPAYPLPTISQPVVIDGTTQTGFVGAPIIEIDGAHGNGGNGVGGGVDGLILNAGKVPGAATGTTIKGIWIDGFTRYGINLRFFGSDTIQGNYIGEVVSILNDPHLPNYCSGIFIDNIPDNVIGGVTSADRNVISGNGITPKVCANGAGVEIAGSNATNNVIEGNYIGTDPTGGIDRGNLDAGVMLIGAPSARVGGMNGTTPGGPCTGACNVISGNNGGVQIDGTGASGNLVEGNYIGTKANGAAALGNSGNGVYIKGAPSNIVGGLTAAARNVIAKNGTGIRIEGAAATLNVVEGNLIGTDVSGALALGNASGIYISGAPGNTIGGTTAVARNIVSGNVGTGVTISGSLATGNLVQGNYIGLDVSGTTGLGNSAGQGVLITSAPGNTIGGTVSGAGNVISGNTASGSNGDGVRISGSAAQNNFVQRNLIGTDYTGTQAIGNGADGIRISDGQKNIIGGLSDARNIISGNGPICYVPAHCFGVEIMASGTGQNAKENKVQGNYIGTTADGNGALRNGGEGVYINAGLSGSATGNIIGRTADGAGNVISNNGRGVTIQGAGASGNFVQGNLIGLNAAGTARMGNVGDSVFISSAPSNTIGGTTPEARNIISGSVNAVGVDIFDLGSHDNLVQGNYIGTDITGAVTDPDTVPNSGDELGNGADGIFVNNAPNNTIGGTTAGAGNLISGNYDGVAISGLSATGNGIQGNRIGTNAAGTGPLGNQFDGVRIGGYSANTTVGGTAAGAGNLIAFNGGNGVLVDTSIGNGILGNSIHDNVGNPNVTPRNWGLGIDLVSALAGWGVTLNDPGDPDTGGNNYQNFPVLAGAWNSGANTNIYGFLNSTPSTAFRVELFSNDVCNGPPTDPSRPLFGEGQTYLGFVTVTTNSGGAGQPIGGSAFFSISVAGSLAGKFITATATDPGNNTSEFSQCVQVTTPPGPDTDGDGYRDQLETEMGKNPTVYCGIMRADVNYDGVVSILDLAAVATQFGQLIPPANPRYDQDADNHISILDLAKQAQVYGQSVWGCP